MKNIPSTLLLAWLLMGSAYAMCAPDRNVTIEQLPRKAQLFIKQHFAKVSIVQAQQDTDRLDGDYEVTFSDGSKVEFQKNGQWSDVESPRSMVPTALVPMTIRQYVAQKYPDTKIVKIDRDTRGYDIELSSGIDLKFDAKGHFKAMDD